MRTLTLLSLGLALVGCRRTEPASTRAQSAQLPAITTRSDTQLPPVAPISDEERTLAANSGYVLRQGDWGSTYVPDNLNATSDAPPPPVDGSSSAAAWSATAGGIRDTRDSVAVYIAARADRSQTALALVQSATIPEGFTADSAAPYTDPWLQGFEGARRRVRRAHPAWPKVGWIEARIRGARVYWLVCTATSVNPEGESLCDAVSRRFRPPPNG